jgi:hypothetical protein
VSDAALADAMLVAAVLSYVHTSASLPKIPRDDGGVS